MTPIAALVAALAPSEASADIVAIDGLAPRLQAGARSHASSQPQTRRIFVNFGGTTLGFATEDQQDDAVHNLTRMESLATTLEGYGGSEDQREAILQAVRADWAHYDVVITGRRPSEPDYVMTHVGPNRPDDLEAKVLGIAHLDCDDSSMRRDVSFAFHQAGDGHDPSDVAMTISHEVGHGFGLEHVDHPGAIMFKTRGDTDPSFVDDCLPILPAQNIDGCRSQRQETCSSSDRQNSHQDLLRLLGPARVDETAPSVSLLDDIEALAVPADVTVDLAVVAHDDVLVERVVLYLDGEELGDDISAPFGWKLGDVEPGEYEFYVEAFDQAGNSTLSEPVTVYVGIEPPEGVNAESPFADADEVMGDPAVGCSCTTGRTSPPLAWGLLLLPLLLRNREPRSYAVGGK